MAGGDPSGKPFPLQAPQGSACSRAPWDEKPSRIVEAAGAAGCGHPSPGAAWLSSLLLAPQSCERPGSPAVHCASEKCWRRLLEKICLFSPQFPGLSRAGKGPVAGPCVQARLGGTAVLRTRLSSRLCCCFCAAPSSCVPRFPLLYPHFPSEVPQAACCKESCKSQGTSNGCVSHLENPWSLCLGTPGRPKGRCCCSDPCSAGRGAAVCPAPGAARWGSQPGGEDVPWSVPRGAMDPGLCTCLGW